MKEKLGKQIIKNTIVFFLYVLTIESVVKYAAFKEVFNYSFLRISISSLIIAIIISVIISLLKGRAKKILSLCISLFIMIYSWIEVNLFFYLGFFMGIGNAEQGVKVIDYFKEFLANINITTLFMLVPFLLINLYYLYLSPKIKQSILDKTSIFVFKFEKKSKKYITILTTVIFLFFLGFTYSKTLTIKVMQNELQSISNKTLFKYPDNPNLSVSQFGVLMYGLTDIRASLFDYQYNPDEVYTYIDDELKNKNEIETRDIDDTTWLDLIENENSSTLNNLNNYFISREITQKNEYTGIFEGKNLIMIMMESVNEIILDEELFPNIYKLYDEGISFTNHYSPRNSCSTGNNELTSLTSLYTINNTCTANTYKNNVYPQSIFNMFNSLNYYTSSYHNYAEAYYSRRTIHPNLGSMSYKNVSDLGIRWSGEYKEWPSDTLLITESLEHFIDEEQFMTFMITVTSHQPYKVSSEFGDKYLDDLDEYDYNIELKRYLSKLMELDSAIELLISSLTERDLLDDTVIVLYGDHYPYGISNNILNEILDYDLDNNQVDRTPLIIYNSETNKEKVDSYVSLVDITPTLLNMFNIDYDPRLYLGSDIFSDTSKRVIFADGSWRDEHGFYSSTRGKFIENEDATYNYTLEEIIDINSEVSIKTRMSTLAIRNNYFNYLGKNINMYPYLVDENKEV